MYRHFNFIVVQFEDRVEGMIKILESQAYYTSHDDDLNKAEKLKYEEGQKLPEVPEGTKVDKE